MVNPFDADATDDYADLRTGAVTTAPQPDAFFTQSENTT